MGYDDLGLAVGESTPCIGDDALKGVYFHPHVQEQVVAEDQEPREGKAWDLSSDYAAKQIKRLCPTIGSGQLAKDVHEDILLIITFYTKEYHNIPLLEIMYRSHFKNILYCGKSKEIKLSIVEVVGVPDISLFTWRNFL